MDISKLHSGDVFKNYKELCSALGIEPKTSNSKKKQLKEIESVITYHRSGQSFVIDSVNEVTTAPIMDLSKLKKASIDSCKKDDHLYYHFSNYVQAILMQYLVYATEDGILDVPMIQLCKIVGLLGSNYDSYSVMVNFNQDNPEIPISEIHAVKNKAYQKVYSITNYALQRLRAKRLIDYRKVYFITDTSNNTWMADDNEVKEILSIEREIFNAIGVKTINEIYIRGLMKDYYSILNEKVAELFEWKCVNRKIHIVYLRNYMVKEIERLSLIAAKQQVNINLVDYLCKKTVMEHKKKSPGVFTPEMLKIFESKMKPEDILYRYPFEECMSRFLKIAETFIEYVVEDDSKILE
nr:MAG TPA: hypothetical protein [Caudoviricetes sp.]